MIVSKKEVMRELLSWRTLVFLAVMLVFVYLAVAFYHTHKPLPQGISFEGPVRYISEDDIDFLYDLTYSNEKGESIVQQEIFNTMFESIRNAKRLVIMDMFLFNDDYSEKGKGKESMRNLTDQLTSLLVEKKYSNPQMQIVLITDEINNFYGSYVSDEIALLRASNVTVVVTDLMPLRDSNPWYSSLWRMGLQWWGTEGTGSLKNPLGSSGQKVTLRSYLNLLNTKANHRKVLVADMNDTLVSYIVSANPHDASSRHSNIGFKIKGEFGHDVITSERAVALLSDVSLGNTSAAVNFDTSLPRQRIGVQLLTEGKVKKSLIRDINSMLSGESIELAMFYLSDRDVINALERADNRGVHVRIILDPNKDAFSREKNGIPNRQTAYELVSHSQNLSLRWYNTKGEQFHTKLIVMHNPRQTTIYGGSPNYTRRNIADLNLEECVRITAQPHTPLSQEVSAYIDKIWNNEGGEYTLDYRVYEDSSWLKYMLYRFQERSGFSSF